MDVGVSIAEALYIHSAMLAKVCAAESLHIHSIAPMLRVR